MKRYFLNDNVTEEKMRKRGYLPKYCDGKIIGYIKFEGLYHELYASVYEHGDRSVGFNYDPFNYIEDVTPFIQDLIDDRMVNEE